MKGLKWITIFLCFLIATYFGVLFVDQNREEVVIQVWGNYQSRPVSVGMVILSSIFLGMIFSALLFTYEILVLKWKIRKLEKTVKEFRDSPSFESWNPSGTPDSIGQKSDSDDIPINVHDKISPL